MNDATAIQREFKFSLGKVIICVIVLLCAMALAVELAPAGSEVGITASAATKSELQKKQAQLETQQKNIAAKLSSLKKSKAAAQDQLDLVNELVENLQTQITTVNNQIAAANAEIKEIEEEIAAKDQEIEDSKEKFKERMKAIYISGDMTGGLEVILCSNGMQEFIDRYDDFARFMAEHGYVVYGHDLLGHGASIRGGDERRWGYFGTNLLPGEKSDS